MFLGIFLYAHDLQFAPKTSNEGLEISYTMSNLFVLSLSSSVWRGKELVENFHNYIVLLKSYASLLSFSLWINTIFCERLRFSNINTVWWKKEEIRVRNPTNSLYIFILSVNFENLTVKLYVLTTSYKLNCYIIK